MAEPKRSLPWGTIIPVGIQALVFAAYVGAADQRITRLEAAVEDTKTIPGRVLVLESRLASIESQLGRVEDKVDRLLQRQTAFGGP